MQKYMISHASKMFKGNKSIEDKIEFIADLISLPFLLKMMPCCHLLQSPMSERRRERFKGTVSKDWFKPV
jgi:hypothetical protein